MQSWRQGSASCRLNYKGDCSDDLDYHVTRLRHCHAIKRTCRVQSCHELSYATGKLRYIDIDYTKQCGPFMLGSCRTWEIQIERQIYSNVLTDVLPSGRRLHFTNWLRAWAPTLGSSWAARKFGNLPACDQIMILQKCQRVLLFLVCFWSHPLVVADPFYSSLLRSDEWWPRNCTGHTSQLSSVRISHTI